MCVLIILMCVVYLILMIIAAHKELFTLQTPVEVSHIDVEKRMADANHEERSIAPDQFKKFRSTLDRTANTSLGYLVAACTIAVFILFGAWANFDSKAVILCILAILAGFLYYTVVKRKQKKHLFIQNREKFRMQLGYVLDTETKSIDYIYRFFAMTIWKLIIYRIERSLHPFSIFFDVSFFNFIIVYFTNIMQKSTQSNSFFTIRTFFFIFIFAFVSDFI